MVFICLSITLKYHLRFNEGRKFHELQNTNLETFINSEEIDKKLKGLNWISHQFKNSPKEEVNLINKIKEHLKKDSRNKMVITNYNFFSTILDQNLFSPNRGYAGDGTTHPLIGNKYEKQYKELMNYLIEKNNISVIYVIDSLDTRKIFHYLDSYSHCLIETHIPLKLKSFDLQSCK